MSKSMQSMNASMGASPKPRATLYLLATWDLEFQLGTFGVCACYRNRIETKCVSGQYPTMEPLVLEAVQWGFGILDQDDKYAVHVITTLDWLIRIAERPAPMRVGEDDAWASLTALMAGHEVTWSWVMLPKRPKLLARLWAMVQASDQQALDQFSWE